MVRRHRLRRRGGYGLPIICAAGFILVAMGAPIRSGETPGFTARSTIAPDQPVQIAMAAPADRPVGPTFTAADTPGSIGMRVPEPELTAPDGVIAGSQPPLEPWQPAVLAQADPAPAAAEPAPEPRIPEPRVERSAPAVVASVSRAVTEEHVVRSTPRPLPPKSPSTELSSAVLGKWVPDQDACTNPETEYLPLQISRVQAAAGEGTCKFVSRKREGRGWTLQAECSDGETTWSSNVNLAVSRGELTWSSERGTQTYVRCENPVRTAKAAHKERQQVASARPAQKVAAHRPAKKATVKAAARPKPALRITSGAGLPDSWAALPTR
jgi:hypothetical protein